MVLIISAMRAKFLDLRLPNSLGSSEQTNRGNIQQELNEHAFQGQVGPGRN